MSEDKKVAGRPGLFRAILFGGLAVGVLDMLDALIFFGWYIGIGIQPVFQGVAAGLLGREAAGSGGWNTWLLGLFLHFCIAFIIAAVYCVASLYLPVLLRHPLFAAWHTGSFAIL